MALTLPGPARPTVLVTDPGPRIAEVVHLLLAQGALVSVLVPEGVVAPETRSTLDDLAGRGLVSLVPAGTWAQGPGSHDVVLRDPHPTASPVATTPVATSPVAASPAVTPTRPEGPVDASGRVILVGGGPGDPGLLTVAGLEAIRRADVLVCDRLAPLAALGQARPDAEVIHVGKIPRGAFTPQEQINALLVDRALAGAMVVRLKGGDSFVFGRGGEEWNACRAAGVPVEVIPGVTSAVAVPALAGIPVTQRLLSPGVVVVSGHVGPSHPRNAVDWAVLARCGLTLVLLMGIEALPEITEALIAGGLDPGTPAACIADGGLPSQRQVVAPLETIAQSARESGIAPPAITVIGPVVTALAPAD